MMRQRLASVVLILFIAGCATIPADQVFFEEPQKINLMDLCYRYQTTCDLDSVSFIITLSREDQVASALVGSDVVLVEDNEVRLNRPIEMLKSNVIVGEDFQYKVLERLRPIRVKSRRKTNYSFYKATGIVIDPGHGGKDSGAIGRGGLEEKKVVLDISIRVKKILEEYGVDVVLTRSTDRFVTLAKRTEIAAQKNADLFVSIHANASRSRSAHGFEVFSLKDLTRQGFKEEQRRKNHELLFSRLNMQQGQPTLNNILEDMLYKKKQIESKKMANTVLKKSTRTTRSKNRGTKISQFFVLRNTLTPAVLVEVGFVSNPKEAKLLKKTGYRQKVARGIAQSLLDYIHEK